MKITKKKQSGFTLIEVLLSMAMLMVVVLPLLAYFSNSSKYNHEAKIQQRAISVGEEIMEEVKTFSTIKDLTDYYAGAVTDTGVVSDDKYYSLGGSEIRNGSGYVFAEKDSYEYWKKGVESDEGKYDVKITVNPKANSNYETINKNGTVSITSLTQKNTAVAKDDDTIKKNAIDFFCNIVAGKGGSTSDKDVEASLTKTYKIDVSGTRIVDYGKETEKRYVMVKILIDYTSSLPDCVGQSYQATMYNGLEVNEDELTGIYLFYKYENNASIELNMGTYSSYATFVNPKNMTFYGICQNVAAEGSGEKQLIPITVNAGTTATIPVFSNISYTQNGGGEQPAKPLDDIVGNISIQRIAEIKVEVFQIKNGVTAKTSRVSLTSTRGE